MKPLPSLPRSFSAREAVPFPASDERCSLPGQKALEVREPVSTGHKNGAEFRRGRRGMVRTVRTSTWPLAISTGGDIHCLTVCRFILIIDLGLPSQV